MSSAVDLEPEPELGDSTAAVASTPKPRRGRRAAIATVSTASVVVLALLAYLGAALLHPLPTTAAVIPAEAITPITTAAVAPAWPTQGGAAVGLVGQAGLLGSSGSDASVPIASITKTITALVLLDKYPLKAGDPGPTITFGQGDVDILNQVWAEDGSWATVQAGEQLTLTQAMTVMMLKSANNYARSLAVWSYGSQDAFVDAANAWLAQHGFTHTHMTDPSGLDPGSVSNMTDLVGIGELAIANPALAAVVNTTSATMPAPVGEIQNTDPLIGKDGIEGVKTGFTDQAGHCLLFASKVTINGTPRTMVGVMVGQPTYDALWSGVPALLASYEKAFHQVDLTDAGRMVYATYSTPWGGSTRVVAASRPSVEIYSASSIAITVTADRLAAVAAKAKVGTVTFSYGGKAVVADLTTERAIEAPTTWWKLTHPQVLFGWQDSQLWRDLFDKRSLLGS
ncbi:D-alanyl-D-alanine carboxypeptidase family protein [Gryllotalpicola protaetiae]|uniref:D-alanyl-D-alanine carboxypeptidase n=1 Tax=Gryllotalpicola protaetiae TaxID=2419771 RepID=A0A387BRY4_9MICO|nr:serine hydrolase [Gryllotalpicola protaetiae]AYG04844.1 D-alanyl-D-alanine carboxypeptidase [Gryllotalpicola protaetiae]